MRYGIICCTVWDHPDFRALSPNGMLAMIYLWTHQKRNSCGIYRSSVVAMGDLYPRPLDEFLEGFAEAEAAGFVFQDHANRTILLHSYVKYCHPGNTNIVKSWIPIIATIPSESPLKKRWYEETLGALKEGFAESFRQWFAGCFTEPLPKPEKKATEPIHQPSNNEAVKPQVHAQETPQVPKPKAPKCSDEEFIEDLRRNTAYRGLDIDMELGKMDAWLGANAPTKKRTRRFIVNWLNRSAVSTRDVAVNRRQGPTQEQGRKLSQHGQRNAAVVQQMIQRKREGTGDA